MGSVTSRSLVNGIITVISLRFAMSDMIRRRQLHGRAPYWRHTEKRRGIGRAEAFPERRLG